MNYWPYVVILVLLGLMLALSMRNRRRAAAAEAERASGIGFGSEVMTTSGLYGTVVRRNDDDTVQLAIASGVEVKWAVAALRLAAELPERYRQGLPETGADEPADRTGGDGSA